MNKLTKTGLVSVAAAIAVALAPQAAFAAKKKTKAHHHHVVHKVNPKTHKITHKVVTHAGPYEHAPSYASAAEVAALRAELAKVRAESAKKSEVKAVADQAAAGDAAVDAKVAKLEENQETDTLFFRGGYAKMSHARGTPNNSPELLVNQTPDNGDGWYVGAGFDHRLTNDLWGLTDLIKLDGEPMFEYKNFGSGNNTLVGTAQLGNAPAGVFLGANSVGNKITEFTLTASPKMKFNTGTPFTPWIIPFGLGIHVISPPSNGVTVLNPGLMVGAGGEVELSKHFVAGIDFRYHFTGNDLKGRLAVRNQVTGQTAFVNTGTSTDGLTTGAYFGFKF